MVQINFRASHFITYQFRNTTKTIQITDSKITITKQPKPAVLYEKYYNTSVKYTNSCSHFHVLAELSARWKKPWACWHEFTMSCTVISPMDSSFNPWTYDSRCSPTLALWEVVLEGLAFAVLILLSFCSRLSPQGSTLGSTVENDRRLCAFFRVNVMTNMFKLTTLMSPVHSTIHN